MSSVAEFEEFYSFCYSDKEKDSHFSIYADNFFYNLQQISYQAVLISYTEKNF